MYFINPSQINHTFMYQRPQQLNHSFSKNGFKSIFVSKNIHLDGAKEYTKPEEIGNLTIVPEGTPLENYKPAILYINYPPNIKFKKKLKPKCTIFDSVDEPTGVFQFWNMNGEYYEALETADLVLASAKSLYKTAQKYNDNVLFIPNACDFNHFSSKTEKPEYYKLLNGPIILYMGAIATWLDRELIYKLAGKHPEYNIVLIGASMNDHIEVIKPNIHILGHKPYEDLPPYVNHANVLIIPFREKDPVVHSTHPVKLYEYFCTGNPVVTTAMPETKIEGVYWGKGHNTFIKNIERAVNENNTKKRVDRIQRAKENTWDIRTKEIIKRLGEMNVLS
jgi:hypothetical protein